MLEGEGGGSTGLVGRDDALEPHARVFGRNHAGIWQLAPHPLVVPLTHPVDVCTQRLQPGRRHDLRQDEKAVPPADRRSPPPPPPSLSQAPQSNSPGAQSRASPHLIFSRFRYGLRCRAASTAAVDARPLRALKCRTSVATRPWWQPLVSAIVAVCVFF